MSRWTSPALVRLGQRVAHLPQQVDGPLGRQRAEPLDQRVQVEPVQQLHHVVERAVVGHAEVVELDGVRRAQRRGGLGLALEARLQLGVSEGLVRAASAGSA